LVAKEGATLIASEPVSPANRSHPWPRCGGRSLREQRLALAGVPVKEIYFPEMFHGFLNMGAVLPQAEAAVQQIVRAVHRLRD
jgi:acetyl esterase/lipase